MKKRNIVVISFLIFFIGIVIVLFVRKMNPLYHSKRIDQWITSEGNYVYPVVPEDEKWAQMDLVERRASCNMPQEVVDMLTTKQLVNAALDYPLKMEYMSFDHLEWGLEHLKGISNIYEELFKREDITENLLAAYRDLEVDYDLLVAGTANHPMEESGYGKELVLQLLIGSDEIFDSLTDAQLEELLAAVDARWEQKKGKCDDFTTAWSRNHPFFLYKMGILKDGEYIK